MRATYGLWPPRRRRYMSWGFIVTWSRGLGKIAEPGNRNFGFITTWLQTAYLHISLRNGKTADLIHVVICSAYSASASQRNCKSIWLRNLHDNLLVLLYFYDLGLSKSSGQSKFGFCPKISWQPIRLGHATREGYGWRPWRLTSSLMRRNSRASRYLSEPGSCVWTSRRPVSRITKYMEALPLYASDQRGQGRLLAKNSLPWMPWNTLPAGTSGAPRFVLWDLWWKQKTGRIRRSNRLPTSATGDNGFGRAIEP